MNILVIGGSASGKSEFAENIAVSLSNKDTRLYIATMQPFGEEAMKRIDRHIKLRESKGFESVDCYKELAKLDFSKHYDAVLLECMSNLLANEMFAEGADILRIADKILLGIENTLNYTDNLVVVSNDIGFDINDYSPETKEYISLLGEINRRLAKRFDSVYEVVCGIPIAHKSNKQRGSSQCLNGC